MDSKELIIGLCSCAVGFYLGYSVMENAHREELIEINQTYNQAIREARTQEKIWQEQAIQIENEYQDKIRNLERVSADTVDRLRKQLDQLSSRVPKDSNTSGKSDGSNGRTNVSENIKQLVGFSEQCAKRADELILQVRGLQQWYKDTSQ